MMDFNTTLLTLLLLKMPTCITLIGRPVSFASVSRMCLVGFGVWKDFHRIDNRTLYCSDATVCHLVKGQLEDLKLLGLDSGARTSSLCPPWTILPLVTLGGVVLGVPVDRTWAFSTIRSDKKVSAGNNGGIWQQPELLLQAKRGQLGVNFKCCSIEG